MRNVTGAWAGTVNKKKGYMALISEAGTAPSRGLPGMVKTLTLGFLTAEMRGLSRVLMHARLRGWGSSLTGSV